GGPAVRHLHALTATQAFARSLEEIELHLLSRSTQRGYERLEIALVPLGCRIIHEPARDELANQGDLCEQRQFKGLTRLGRYKRFDAVPIHEWQVGVTGILGMTDQTEGDGPT